MNTEKEYVKTVRCLKILSLIASRPYRYTRKELAEKFDVSKDTIKRDLEAITSAQFTVDFDKQYRYGLLEDKRLAELQSLLIFSKQEEETMLACLRQSKLNSVVVDKLQKKLQSIFHAAQLNHVSNRNFLNKMDILEAAKKEKKVVIFKDYHSTNSSTKSDRKVEVFHISVEDDIVHCFDWDRKEIRHFRISRVRSVITLDEGWLYEPSHEIVPTDCFRIQDKNLVSVRLVMNVGAYNELLERFPNTYRCLEVCVDNEQQYVFSAKVNHKFYGLTNFILGHSSGIVEIQPTELVEHIRKEAQSILENKNW